MDWVAGSVADYVDRWGIVQDGDPITTPSSWIVRGRWRESDVMLKVARVAEEARGGRVLAWWAGAAAATVYKVNEQAVLIELASERQSLSSTHVVLHGYIHHGNVLDFGGHWRAIDPKGLVGDRAFDYANIFCNPSAGIALAKFDRRLAIVSEHSRLDIETVRTWAIAWCALAVAWSGEHKSKPWAAHAILREFG